MARIEYEPNVVVHKESGRAKQKTKRRFSAILAECPAETIDNLRYESLKLGMHY